MKQLLNNTAGSMPEATAPSEWVEAHGDYLFNFAARCATQGWPKISFRTLSWPPLKLATVSPASPLSEPGWSASCVTKFTIICDAPAASAQSEWTGLRQDLSRKLGTTPCSGCTR